MRKMVDCELVRRRTKIRSEVVKVNRPYDRANCYLCGKELKGAGKTGKVKNRNNVEFWGIASNYKILCLRCIGEKFYERMKSGKKKTWRKYLGRGYE